MTENIGRDITPRETSKIDDLLKEAESLKAKFDKLEAIEAAEGNLSPPLQPGDHYPFAGKPKPGGHHTLRAFENPKAAYQAGRWLDAVVTGNEASRAWVRDHLPMGAGNEGTGTGGGFVVPEEMSRAIIRLVEE